MGLSSSGSQSVQKSFVEEVTAQCRMRLKRFGLLLPNEDISPVHFVVWAHRFRKDFTEFVLREMKGDVLRIYLSHTIRYRFRGAKKLREAGREVLVTVGEFSTKIVEQMLREASMPGRFPNPLIASPVPFDSVVASPEAIQRSRVYSANVEFLRAEMALDDGTETGGGTMLKSMLSGSTTAARAQAARDADVAGVPANGSVPVENKDGGLMVDLPDPTTVQKAKSRSQN